jgi:hypothetical protein
MEARQLELLNGDAETLAKFQQTADPSLLTERYDNYRQLMHLRRLSVNASCNGTDPSCGAGGGATGPVDDVRDINYIPKSYDEVIGSKYGNIRNWTNCEIQFMHQEHTQTSNQATKIFNAVKLVPGIRYQAKIFGYEFDPEADFALKQKKKRWWEAIQPGSAEGFT